MASKANKPVKINPVKSKDEEYKMMTHHEHVLKLPDSYIGSREIEDADLDIWDDSHNRIVRKKVKYVPGLYKIYDEILVNARDHTVRCSSCDTIKIFLDKTTGRITAWNNGDGISISKSKEHDIYFPEMIFGHLLSSGNYDKTGKTVGGKNGYGAKLTNIFSKEFIVETIDTKTKQKYTQKFTENMYSKEEPKITKIDTTKNKSYTQVSFIPDYKYFGLDNLDDTHYSLFKKRVYDLAATTSNTVKVYFNDEKLDVATFEDYIHKYYPADKDIGLIYEEFNPRWRVGVVYDTSPVHSHISFVNGICTFEGGTHVNYIRDQIVDAVITAISKQKDCKGLVVRESAVKNVITVYVDSVIIDPSFDSQTKQNLKTPRNKFGSTCELDKKFIDRILKSGLLDDVIKFSQFKAASELKKTDGKLGKRSLKDIPKLEDAYFAGKGKRHECTLILTEGDSAAKFARDGLSVLGREKYGIFPLRGKVLNVRDTSMADIAKNAEITNIKKILGLKQNKEYTHVKDLRYGRVLILTDQDVDGYHIKGLVLNLFGEFWPSLLKINGFLTTMSTPIVKAIPNSKKQNVLSFFNLQDYKRWADEKKEAHELGRYTIKYYKGLATSEKKEATECFENFEDKVVNFIWENSENMEIVEHETSEESETSNIDDDNETEDKDVDEPEDEYNEEEYDKKLRELKQSPSYQAIALAFDKHKADDRKEWINEYNPDDIFNILDTDLYIPDFINKQLRQFSVEDTHRSVPCMCDGLKPSQRKIMYVAILKNLYEKEMKVEQLSGYVAAEGHYHHGATSLNGAIVNLAQDYVGSNNIPLLFPSGNFGTRYKAGEDAGAARYIFTRLSDLTKLIFRKEDAPLLEHIYEDGFKAEPNYFHPIVCLPLINGVSGIGTGYSTLMPPFNPLEQFENIRNYLKGKPFNKMMPYLIDYKGIIKRTGDNSYLSLGKYKIETNNTLLITELPYSIRPSRNTVPFKYEEYLKTLVADNPSKPDKGQILDELFSDCNSNRVHFKLKFLDNHLSEMFKSKSIVKKMGLETQFTVSNITFFDENYKIKKYESPEHLLEEFCDYRLQIYKQRFDYYLEQLKYELIKLKAQATFVKAKIDKKITIENISKDKICELLETSLKLPKLGSDWNSHDDDKNYDYILLKLNMLSLSMEKVNELLKKAEEKQNEYDEYIKKTPAQIWLEELNELEKEYIKYEEYIIEKYNEDKIKKEVRKSKTKKTSVKSTKSIKLN
jgi:DNA topoisomerase II